MNRVRLSYLKLTPLVAILAITLIPSPGTSAAMSKPAAAGADLANEERVLGKYFDDLFAYETQCLQLGKRAAFANADINPLQAKSDDLKGRLSAVQNTVREIVRKLKAANEWEDVDTITAAGIDDPGLKSLFQRTSLKRLLENSSNNLSGQANEISSPLDKLRKRLTSRYGEAFEVQFVRAGYGPPAATAEDSLGCRIGQMRLRVAIKIGSTPSKEVSKRIFDRCHPNGIFETL
jgi:chaperonin cofactor prefoldin